MGRGRQGEAEEGGREDMEVGERSGKGRRRRVEGEKEGRWRH